MRISNRTARHSEIAWSRIVGLRNRIVRGYLEIDDGIVWRIVKNDLPEPISQLEPIVPPENG